MALYGCVVVGGMGDLGLRLGPHATIIGAFGLGYRKVERYMLTLGTEAGFGWLAGSAGGLFWGANELLHISLCLTQQKEAW